VVNFSIGHNFGKPSNLGGSIILSQTWFKKRLTASWPPEEPGKSRRCKRLTSSLSVYHQKAENNRPIAQNPRYDPLEEKDSRLSLDILATAGCFETLQRTHDLAYSEGVHNRNGLSENRLCPLVNKHSY